MAARIPEMSMLAAEFGDPPEMLTPEVSAHRRLRAMISPISAIEAEAAEQAARDKFFGENPTSGHMKS